MQVFVGDADGDGMSVELLEPWATEQNDFLARFVARHGAGPHHLTFKVPDLSAALERLRGAGFQPVNIDLSDPEWKEAFLMPREAHGTVVQLAETARDFGTRADLLAHVAEHGPNMHPRWWVDPEPPRVRRRSCAASCCARPTFRRRSASSPACCRATVDCRGRRPRRSRLAGQRAAPPRTAAGRDARRRPARGRWASRPRSN